jgi:Tol biopolymer transport system component
VRPGAEPRALEVTLAMGERTNPVSLEVLRDGATEFAVSPAEDEVAFVVRGEVFVASVEHGTTRRITSTPEQERDVAWSPDGKTLFYAGERDGSWNLYRAVLGRPDEERFFRATLVEESALLAGAEEEFQPLPSPDGKSLAYLRDRDEIRVLDLASGQSRALVPAARNYSYEDGDLRFVWSPDSQWLVTTVSIPGRWIADVAVVHAATGAVSDMTASGYEEWAPAWSADGTALVYVTNRFGRREHGGYGSDADLMALDLTQEAHDRSHLSAEEYEREKKKGKEGGKGEKGEEKPRPPDPLRVELQGCEERTRRLTLHSTPVGGFALSPDGEKVV